MPAAALILAVVPTMVVFKRSIKELCLMYVLPDRQTLAVSVARWLGISRGPTCRSSLNGALCRSLTRCGDLRRDNYKIVPVATW